MQNHLPFVSVIIPCRNEAGFIGRCIDSSLASSYPHDKFEILVMDGMSTDRTREIVERLFEKHEMIKWFENPKKIVSTAFNLGVKKARGEIILIVGGHCEIAPDYIQRCVETMVLYNVECVGGYIETIGTTWRAQAIALAMSSPFGVGNVAFRTRNKGCGFVDTVAFGAYSRKLIDKVGFFDEELVRNQDDEYNYRLRELGFKIFFSSDIRARYYSRSSLINLASQYSQYGFWKVRVMQKHPRQMQWRQFVPPLFVLSVLFGLILISFSRMGLMLLAAVLGSYVVLNLMFSILLGFSKGLKYILVLPLVYATLHFAYGSGFLCGLIYFMGKWRIKSES